MSKNYQLRRTGYAMPHNTYMQVKYLIRDYGQMRREREEMLPPAGDTKRLALLNERIAAIEEAAAEVNAAYGNCARRAHAPTFDALLACDEQNGFAYFQEALYNPAKNRAPSYMTWRRCRQMLAYLVARNLNLL